MTLRSGRCGPGVSLSRRAKSTVDPVALVVPPQFCVPPRRVPTRPEGAVGGTVTVDKWNTFCDALLSLVVLLAFYLTPFGTVKSIVLYLWFYSMRNKEEWQNFSELLSEHTHRKQSERHTLQYFV